MTTAAGFDTITVDQLEAARPHAIDELPFGVIGLNGDGLVEVFNAAESRLAGLSPDRVIGQHFFESVAICMNNYMVAQRFQDEATLDETIDYVLTFRMRPTKVQLRLLKRPGNPRSYVLVNR